MTNVAGEVQWCWWGPVVLVTTIGAGDDQGCWWQPLVLETTSVAGDDQWCWSFLVFPLYKMIVVTRNSVIAGRWDLGKDLRRLPFVTFQKTAAQKERRWLQQWHTSTRRRTAFWTSHSSRYCMLLWSARRTQTAVSCGTQSKKRTAGHRTYTFKRNKHTATTSNRVCSNPLFTTINSLAKILLRKINRTNSFQNNFGRPKQTEGHKLAISDKPHLWELTFVAASRQFGTARTKTYGTSLWLFSGPQLLKESTLDLLH